MCFGKKPWLKLWLKQGHDLLLHREWIINLQIRFMACSANSHQGDSDVLASPSSHGILPYIKLIDSNQIKVSVGMFCDYFFNAFVSAFIVAAERCRRCISKRVPWQREKQSIKMDCKTSKERSSLYAFIRPERVWERQRDREGENSEVISDCITRL